MKKLLALMLCIVLTVSLVACSGDETEPTESITESTTESTTTEESTTEESIVEEVTDALVEADPYAPTELTAFVDGLYEGYTEELPALLSRMITEEEFEYLVCTPYVEGMEAAISEPMMGSIAHSVIVLELPEGSDVEAIRADIEANADPRRWICVEAEQVTVVANGNTILFVMSTADLTATLVDNFNAKTAA